MERQSKIQIDHLSIEGTFGISLVGRKKVNGQLSPVFSWEVYVQKEKQEMEKLEGIEDIQKM